MGSPKGGSNGGGSIATYKFNSLTLSWEPYGSIVEELSPGEEAGYSISLSESGSTMVVGFPKATNLVGAVDAGKTAVYIMSESEWQLLGQEVYGEAESYIDGTSVAMSRDGSTVVIGGKGRNQANETTGEVVLGSVGHCRIYQVRADRLVFQHSMVGKGAEERLGSSAAVSSDGNVAACGGAGGARGGGDSVTSGVVRVWNRAAMRESAIWPRGEVADSDGATFGTSLAISADGEYVTVGAPSWRLNNGGGASAGAVQVFRAAT